MNVTFVNWYTSQTIEENLQNANFRNFWGIFVTYVWTTGWWVYSSKDLKIQRKYLYFIIRQSLILRIRFTKECTWTKSKMYLRNNQTQSCSIKSYNSMQKIPFFFGCGPWKYGPYDRCPCLYATNKPQNISRICRHTLFEKNPGHQGLYVVWVLSVCIRHEYEHKTLIFKISIKSQDTKNMDFPIHLKIHLVYTAAGQFF